MTKPRDFARENIENATLTQNISGSAVLGDLSIAHATENRQRQTTATTATAQGVEASTPPSPIDEEWALATDDLLNRSLEGWKAVHLALGERRPECANNYVCEDPTHLGCASERLRGALQILLHKCHEVEEVFGLRSEEARCRTEVRLLESSVPGSSLSAKP